MKVSITPTSPKAIVIIILSQLRQTMPEIRFQVQWPDGSQDVCYSPSLIVQDYFEPGVAYDLKEFVERSRTALKVASDRVNAKYGAPCGLALGQLRSIETRAIQYQDLDDPKVRLIQFIR